MGAFDFIEDPEVRAKVEATSLEQAKTVQEDVLRTKIDEATSGLKSKMEQLLDEKKKVADKLKEFDGVDIAAAKSALAFLENDEKAKLIRDGKIEDLLAKETSAIKASSEARIAEISTKLQEESTAANLYKRKFETKVIEDSIREAAIKAGVRPEALTDVLYRGRDIFSLGSDSSIEARDSNGALRKTTDDMILTPENWVNTLKTSAPHYWPPSNSGDLKGLTDKSTEDDIRLAMDAAAKKNDMVLYRKLRAKLK